MFLLILWSDMYFQCAVQDHHVPKIDSFRVEDFYYLGRIGDLKLESIGLI